MDVGHGNAGLTDLANLFNPGLAEQALPSFVNLILIAGFALHSRAAIVTTIIAATSVTAYLILMVHQLLPEPFYPYSMVVKIPAISITVLTTGGIVTLALRHMTNALNRERQAKKDALLSSQSLAKALDDNALRATLSGHLVELSQRLLEESGPSEQRQILLEQCMAVDGIYGAQVLDADENILHDNTEPSNEGAPLQNQIKVMIPGQQRARFLSVNGAPILVNAEATIGFLNTAVALVAEAAARATAQSHLQRAEQMQTIGRLSAGVAHDFNNLLTAILGGVEMAQLRSKQALPTTDELDSIRVATERAMGLTRKMMAFSDSKAHEREQIDLARCIEELSLVFRQTVPSRIVIDVVDPIPDCHITAERIELEQILLNLVHNARDAIEGEGRIQIQVELQPVGDLPHVVIHVSDTGCGMSSAIQEQIYEPFFTTHAQEGGHGLGLTGVQALIKRLKGTIHVESEVGIGTRFTVSLPTTINLATNQPQSETKGPTKHPEFAPIDETQILLVEDNPQVREVVQTMLESDGATVITANSGEEALVLLNQLHRIDLMISDVLMPGIDGHELLRIARSQAPLPHHTGQWFRSQNARRPRQTPTLSPIGQTIHTSPVNGLTSRGLACQRRRHHPRNVRTDSSTLTEPNHGSFHRTVSQTGPALPHRRSPHVHSFQ